MRASGERAHLPHPPTASTSEVSSRLWQGATDVISACPQARETMFVLRLAPDLAMDEQGVERVGVKVYVFILIDRDRQLRGATRVKRVQAMLSAAERFCIGTKGRIKKKCVCVCGWGGWGSWIGGEDFYGCISLFQVCLRFSVLLLVEHWKMRDGVFLRYFQVTAC